MKNFFIILLISLLYQNLTEAQKLPDSSNVLVVYNSMSLNSIEIMNYYKNARGIPESNIVELNGLDTLTAITDPLDGSTHTIVLQQGAGNDKEIIADATILSYNPIYRHSWLYFVDRIASPIAEHLRTTIVNGDTLKNIISFIVLCKGVPFRILTHPDDGGSCNQNVAVDGLLCFLGEDINNPYHLMDYLNMEGAVGGECQGTYEIENPYYNADPNFFMDQNFVPNYYSSYNSHFNRDITLSYLITHLDGMSVNDVKNMIDSSIAAINSSGYDWFIDSDPTPCRGSSQILYPSDTKNVFDALGITNYLIDNTNAVYTNHVKPIMSYCSNGTHTSENPNDNCDLFFQPDYIQTQLGFTYIAGSVFNTAESFNVNTLGTVPPVRRDGAEMGQIPEFIHEGGTVGVGQVIHGPLGEGGIINNNAIMLPSYALGYSFIEAAYLGMPHLTATRIVVGDPLTRIAYPCEPTVLTSNTVINSGTYDCGIIVPSGITLTIQASSEINLIHNAYLKIDGNLVIENNANLNVFNFGGIKILGKAVVGSNSSLKIYNNGLFNIDGSGEIVFGNYANIQTYDESIVDCKGKITCNQGVEIVNGNIFKVANKLFLFGTEHSPINIYSDISYNDIDSLVVNWTNFQNSIINIDNNYRKGIIDIEFSNFINSEMDVSNFVEVNIIKDNFNRNQDALAILGSHISNVKDCIFNDCHYGIVVKPGPHEVNLSDSLFIINCSFIKVNNLLASPNGILITNVDTEFSYLKIDSSIFDGCANSISLNKFDNCNPIISNCTITDYETYGISLTNGSSAVVNHNLISTSNSSAENPIGIYLSQVTGPQILWNTITTDVSDPGSGIVSISSSGEYKSNLISGYYNGVELGNSSSPYMALNQIHNNKNYGLYISTSSNPLLNKGFSDGTGYPLSGYNYIYENGLATGLTSDPEIYLNTANIQLSKGCNTIADDRNIYPYNHRILIDGISVRYDIIADSNYWGNHPIYVHNPAQRFGTGVRVRYAPYDTIACSYSQGSSMLLLTTPQGIIADTVFSDGTIAGQLNSIETAYSNANGYFYSCNYSEAENTYKQIINESEDSTYSLEAYNRLYLIKKYQNANSQGYENLRQYYQGKLSSIEDTTILLAVNNLKDMCSVSKNEFDQAISSFDDIVQNNPGTDIALYNNINAYTTALLLDSSNGLGKAAKYRTSDISEYLKNVSELLKTRGKNVESEKNNLIPTKFYLYQNYPNPFNPVTTIKYAIPKTVNVELKVFDILGREVKTLVNDTKNPGYYEVQFNAGNYASGVYFYRIKAGEFIKTGKMLLVK